VDYKILSITETPDGTYQVDIDLSIKTNNRLFFNEKGRLLGLLPAGEEPISLNRTIKLLSNDIQDEIAKAIRKEKKKWKKRKLRKGKQP